MVSPAHSPVIPAPSPVTPDADGDAKTESQAETDAEGDSRRRRRDVVAIPGTNHRATVDDPRVVVGHVDDCRIRRSDDDVTRRVGHGELRTALQMSGSIR